MSLLLFSAHATSFSLRHLCRTNNLMDIVCIESCGIPYLTAFRYSTVVSIPARHAGDPGSIPGVGVLGNDFSTALK